MMFLSTTRILLIVCLLAAPRLIAVGAVPVRADPDQARIDKSGYHLFNPTPTKYLREMTIDGPGATESPYTVDAGHFQVEMLFVSYTTYHETFTDPDFPDEIGKFRYELWNVAPMILKIGLLNKLDVQVVLEPYNFVYEREFIGDYDLRVKRHGFGDTTLRFKYNLWGNDGGRTALALTPYIKFPTSEQGIGNNGVEGGIILPFEVGLMEDLYVGVTSRFGSVRNIFNSRYHAEFGNSIAVSYDFLDYLSAYVEFFSVLSTERDIDWLGGVSTGVTYWVTDSLQFYAGSKFGLTRSADEWSPFIGMAWRF
jgi:hypothetical protein